MAHTFPVVFKKDLIHIGRLDLPRIEGRNTYEPGCLSVSHCPDVWQRLIRSPQERSKRYTLNRRDQTPLQLVCVHTLLKDPQWRIRVQTYLIEQELAAEATLYQVSCFDDELDDTLISLHPDYDTALIEADEDADAVCSVKALIPTPRLIERLGFIPDPIQMEDVGVAVYFEACEPDVDGLWWEDELNPACYSAPRGGLFQSRLTRIRIES
jgi:hypothetical protein